MRTRRSASSSSDSVSSSPPKDERRRAARSARHIPVLLHEVLELLELAPGMTAVDATLGGGGHALEMARLLGSKGLLIGIDADEAALERFKTRLDEMPGSLKPQTHLAKANFRALPQILAEAGMERIDRALFDLGWSTFQLAAGRGFSFQSDEPLLMTFDSAPAHDALTAEGIVNGWQKESLVDVLTGWGEERYAERIAKAIVEARRKERITTARQLAEIIASAVPRAYARGKIHPATRTFQALRIAVNDEFGALRDGITAAWQALKPGGRLAVISFHSAEDREVKHLMKAWEKAGEGKAVTKSPVTASLQEKRENPPSRSAKLRVIEKF